MSQGDTNAVAVLRMVRMMSGDARLPTNEIYDLRKLRPSQLQAEFPVMTIHESEQISTDLFNADESSLSEYLGKRIIHDKSVVTWQLG